MRMSALSRTTGVPVATVKYYLREGLLPPGEPTGVNQAEYGDVHVRRLRLIRALVEVGNVRLQDVSAILTAVDDDDLAVHDLLGAVQYALAGAPEREAPAWREVRREVDDYLDRLGWRIRPDAPTRNRLADAISDSGPGRPGADRHAARRPRAARAQARSRRDRLAAGRGCAASRTRRSRRRRRLALRGGIGRAAPARAGGRIVCPLSRERVVRGRVGRRWSYWLACPQLKRSRSRPSTDRCRRCNGFRRQAGARESFCCRRSSGSAATSTTARPH